MTSGRVWWCIGLLSTLVQPAAAAPKDEALLEEKIIFAREGALWRTDARGRGPAEKLVALPRAGRVRSLRADTSKQHLVVDIDGSWWWMPLPTGTLRSLPCTTPPETGSDASCLVCTVGNKLSLVHLATGRVTPLPAGTTQASMVGSRAERQVFWANGDGLFAAYPGQWKRGRRVADPPLRWLSVSPNGKRALGVYAGTVHEKKQEVPADILSSFALDGVGARRKVIRNGIPLGWSDDSEWALVQEGPRACLMRVAGGEYKCWKGFHASSIAPDGAWVLVLGDRARSGDAAPARSKRPSPGASAEGESGEQSSDAEGEVAIPSGPLSLFRAPREGAFSDRPILVERDVDGAALWLGR